MGTRKSRSAPDVGDWLQIALSPTGWALARVASVDRRGAMLCYFFGPMDEAPPLTSVPAVCRQEPLLVGLCGDVAAQSGAWPNLGPSPIDEGRDWPIPVFRRHDPFLHQTRRVRYADGQLLMAVESGLSDDPALENAPEDGLMNAKFVEERLSRLAAVPGSG